jgi:hypothetical protein
LKVQLQEAFLIRNEMKSMSEGHKNKVSHYGIIGNYDSLGTIVRSLDFEKEDRVTDSSLQCILRAALQSDHKRTGSKKSVARKRGYQCKRGKCSNTSSTAKNALQDSDNDNESDNENQSENDH